ncbi:MAG: TIR domain-containing protein, partial [Cyanobacteria bacterium P01_D01_bin.56]
MQPSAASKIKVFVSYCDQDDVIKEKLQMHLAMLQREEKIQTWHAAAIDAGLNRDMAIQSHFEAADIILLLVTAEYIASDKCYEQQMRLAIERHNQRKVRVIPIIMKPCDWESSPFGRLKVLPKHGKPVTTWPNQDEALTDAAKGIRQVVDSLARKRLSSPAAAPSKMAMASLPLAESVFTVGPPIAKPHQFFGRQRIVKRLFNLLKTHPLQNAAIIGQRRAGKTSLLNYLRTICTTPAEQLRPGQRNDWLLNPEVYRWIFVDFQDPRMANCERLLEYLLISMKLPIPAPCSLENFMEQVSGQVKQPTVVLMDEIGVGLQRCPELDDTFWESLRSLANHYADGNLAFVLASSEKPVDLAKHNGHSSPFFNIFGYTTTLKPFSEGEAKELIMSSSVSFS